MHALLVAFSAAIAVAKLLYIVILKGLVFHLLISLKSEGKGNASFFCGYAIGQGEGVRLKVKGEKQILDTRL